MERERERDHGERLKRETKKERREKELKIEKYGIHWTSSSHKMLAAILMPMQHILHGIGVRLWEVAKIKSWATDIAL